MKHFLLSVLLSYLSLATFAQTKVSSSTYGAIEARSIGPAVMGGRITAIEGVNKTP